MKKSTLIELFTSYMSPVAPWLDNSALNDTLTYLNSQGEDIPHEKLKAAMEYLKSKHLELDQD